jgi:hypothetical protein
VNHYDEVQTIIKQYDYLGLYLNNRFAYLTYQNSKTRRSSLVYQSNRYFLLIIFTILIIILIGVTFMFISLIRRKTFKEKKLLNKQDFIVTNKSSTKTNLQVTNCYDYNDSSLMMLNKDLGASAVAVMNDNCCLLETIHEKDIYDQQKNKVGKLKHNRSCSCLRKFFERYEQHSCPSE